MEKKSTLKNTLSGISKIGRIMPHSINESMDFNGLDETEELDDMAGEESEPMPVEEEMPTEEKPEGEAMMNSAHGNVQSVPSEMKQKVAKFFDDIRKKSLLGMAELADYPNSVEYEQMKKLWQLCDKKPEPKQGATL